MSDENRVEQKKQVSKIPIPEVGKVYQIVDSRKGAFEGECISIDGEWFDFKITKGIANALLEQNVRTEGEVVTLRHMLIESLQPLEDIVIYSKVAKNLTIEEKLERITREERSLLLYFGARACDFSGKVDVTKMNYDDMAIANRWNIEGLVEFKPINPRSKKNSLCGIDAHHHMMAGGKFDKQSHYVILSEEAWQLEYTARRARADQNFFKTQVLKMKG